MRGTLVTFGALLFLTRLALGSEPPWRASLEVALAEAKEKKQPIFVALGVDQERVCPVMASTHYRDDEMLGLMQNYVCLIASPSRHALVQVGDRKVCELYGTVTCDEHIAVDRQVRSAYLSSDLVTIPQHLVIGPDGKLRQACEFFLTVVQLRRLLSRHLGELRPELALGKEIAQEVQEGKIGEKLREALQSEDSEKRRAATRILTELDPDEVVRAMETTFNSLGSQQKGEMLLALANAGPEVAMPILGRHLICSDAVVRAYAARALGHLGDTQAIIPLRRRITTEPDPSARGSAVDALAHFADDDEGAAKAVVQATGDREAIVRAHAYVALGVCSAPGDQALLKGLESKDRSLCGCAVWACGKRKLKSAEKKIEAARKTFSDVHFKVLVDSALKRIRAQEVDEAFYDGLKDHFLDAK